MGWAFPNNTLGHQARIHIIMLDKTGNRLLKSIPFFGVSAILIAQLAMILWTNQEVWARPIGTNKSLQTSPLHPTFPLLDETGISVLDSGSGVSTMQTCGSCHDTRFIAEHSFHTKVGLDALTNPGKVPNGRPWDISPGYFGKWNPIPYRYLSPQSDDRIDLGTAAWVQYYGARHVGDGPAVFSRAGDPLTELEILPGDPETHIIDPQTGDLTPWDWQESGVVEMNCFLCHIPSPNNTARREALEAGKFRWASTATLVGSGIVDLSAGNFSWNPAAFQESGDLANEFVAIQDPTNANCGLCHGLVHEDIEEPLATAGCSPERWRTITTGQIISPQRLSDTGMNIANKGDLNRPWDIHAERLLECTDCHFSLNNPVYFQASEASRPDHLTFDPRRLEIGEYLYQPLHQFARGQSGQSNVSPELKDTMRRCDSCHSIDATHDWLPYKERHVSALACETCHIPHIYSTSFRQYDWTVIHTDEKPNFDCRGAEGERGSFTTVITGYEPILLPRINIDGEERIAPFNLITSWFWVYGNPTRPVRLDDLRAVWLDGENYHPDVFGPFDQNGNRVLEEGELIIDSPQKERFIAQRLENLGLENPHIVGEIQPYSINHTVATDDWAVKDCQACHSKTSRVTQPILLSSYLPSGTMPALVADSNTIMDGELYTTEDGSLYYRPVTEEQELYILGHDNVRGIDLAGTIFFILTLTGISTHTGLRFWSSWRKPSPEPQIKQVYMYSLYERLWHWLQTFAILALIFTGLIIHMPDTFGIFSFRYVVLVHNVLALTLVINAALALVYHLSSGEIRQYIPRPRGFFDQALTQTIFYLNGIFKGKEHPFEKSPEKKLNPLQQVTYFAILNFLLPLQVITGALMWGAQRFPNLATRLGGLPFLGPFHTLIAWLFASFVILHVYLTTTGHKPLTSIKAMIMGWDEIEVHPPAEEEPVT
jgi:thiosulfate reductase cytochrome b subunit